MSDVSQSAFEAPKLPEFTRRSLAALHRRRQLLAVAAGACSTVVLFALLLLIALAVDAWWFSQFASWIGSAMLYGALATALVGWCLLPKLRRLDLLSEARLLERMDPRLREKLLPAVELSVTHPGIVDSIAFRQRLQLQVVRLLQTVDPRHLLPWTELQPRAALAAASLGLLLALCLVPGLYFPQRVVRILLPWGDWGRVTSIAISLERPWPHSPLVPRHDVVLVRALVRGDVSENVFLETRKPAATAAELADAAPTLEQYEMNQLPDAAAPGRWPALGRSSRFEYLLPVTARWTEYRVLGQGATTPWYRLSTMPRPQVLKFEKRITPPPQLRAQSFPGDDTSKTAATATPTAVVIADDGHLRVLTGSHVELRIHVDQPIRQAELRWETSAASSAGGAKDLSNGPAGSGQFTAGLETGAIMPLRAGASETELRVAFTVTHSNDYHIFLQSRDSGFTNGFSPQYHLEAVADQAPQIAWLAPREPTLLAAAGDEVHFSNQITDECAPAKLTRSIRINDSQWAEESLPVDEVEQPPQAVRSAREFAWDLQLDKLGVEAGDQLEIKLTATDRLGQTAESAVVTVRIATAELASGPSPGELRRRAVAAALQRIVQRMTHVDTQLDGLLLSTAEPEPPGQLAAKFKSVLIASSELQQELTDTWARIEQALAHSDDALNSQTLVHVGEALLATSASVRSATSRLKQLSVLSERDQFAPGVNEVALQMHAVQRTVSDLTQHLAAITTYDALSGFAERLSHYAAAELQLAASQSDAGQSPQQLQRRQRVLVEQLEQTQQAMLEALPLIREESRASWQSAAAHLRHQISVATNLETAPSQSSFNVEMAAALAQQLKQLQLPSSLDRSLPAAVDTALQRLQELAETPAEAVEQLRAALPSYLSQQTYWSTFEEQLEQRRQWERESPQGDRLYATDLGRTLRAAQRIAIPTSLDLQQAVPRAQAIAAAIEVLHGIHLFHQADTLLAELLESERHQAALGQLDWYGPAAWQAIEQRVTAAVMTLRTTGLPGSTVDKLGGLLHIPVAQRAAEVLQMRIWQTDPATPLIAELEELRRRLRPLLQQLEIHGRSARRILDELAPALSELARYAAQQVRRVEQQSNQLADALIRQEVPDMAARQLQLVSQSEMLQAPVDRLRQALTDYADAQDLLNHQQTQLARQADAAREVVDVVDGQLAQARTDTNQALSAEQASATLQASQLRAVAGLQADSAAALEELAEHFRTLEDQAQTVTADQLAAGLSELQQRLSEFSDGRSATTGPADQTGDDDQRDNLYSQAAKLADLAEQNPRAVLEQLERELPTNAPMATEMSSIARQAVQLALQQLEQTGQQQLSLRNGIELSDTHFKAQKELLLHDVQSVAQSTQRMLKTLTSEAQWTAAASKNSQLVESVAVSEASLRQLSQAAQSLNLDVPLDQLLAVAADLQSRLLAAEHDLSASAAELTKASAKDLYQNGAELANRRREMRDRQRRIQQESVRDAQAVELAHVHRLQQSEAELQQQLEISPQRRAAGQNLQAALRQRIERARQALAALNADPRRPLDSLNPAAELAAQLSRQAAVMSGQLARELQTWKTAQPILAQATATQLTEAHRQEAQLAETVIEAAANLARAARHEQRLQRVEVGQQLQQASQTAEQLGLREMHAVVEQLLRAREQTAQQPPGPQPASAAATAAVLAASQAASQGIARVTGALRQLLADRRETSGDASPPGAAGGDAPAAPAAASPSTASPTATTSAAADFPLSATQKARLLDELDQQLIGQQSLGAKEDDSETRPSSGSSNGASPSALSDAAGHIAKRLSQSRQLNPHPDAKADLGMATESLSTNSQPQGAVPVRIIEVDRRNGGWGELPEQAEEELVETRRSTIPPRYRKQTEAYFRELADQGAASVGK